MAREIALHEPELVKFPRTPHLLWLGEGLPRGDKMLSPEEAATLMRKPAAAEEKVDGANVGLSVGPDGRIRAQSRGGYLSRASHEQFRPLWRWLASHEDLLRNVLGEDLILFGEWCYARHTVEYDALPDWLLAFDVYDRGHGRFWSRERRDTLFGRARLTPVPVLATGLFDRARIEQLMGQSRVGSTKMEGIYLRWDDGDWLVHRAKVVRRGWVLADEPHWSRRTVQPNRLQEHRP